MNTEILNMEEYINQNVPSYMIDILANEFQKNNSLSCLYAYTNDKFPSISDEVVSFVISQNEEEPCKKLRKVL